MLLGRHALNVLEDQLTVPPCYSANISVNTQDSTGIQGVTEGNKRLLINHEICVARGIAVLRGR